jgi:mono/diheme cytochrome c family protein
LGRGSKSAWASYRVALALLIALCSSPPARADDADLGREVYEEFCVTCHGRDLVNPGGVTFDLRKFPKDDFERFRSAVLNGKPPAMPAWRGKVGDDDMKLLWAYVRGGG